MQVHYVRGGVGVIMTAKDDVCVCVVYKLNRVARLTAWV